MKRTKPDLYAKAVRDLEPLIRLRDFYEMADQFTTEEIQALIEVEYRRWQNDEPDSEPYYRRLATLAVGYQLALQVMRGLLAGGAR